MFQSLGTARTGLNSAQVGLSVTGHNLSNMNIYGYTRQQALQIENFSINKGYNALGAKQVGTGTTTNTIRQIRDQFLDKQYRTEATKASYYNIKYNVGTEIETTIGELQSDYNTQSVIQDMWDALNELSIDPSSIATRGTFVSTCITMLDKFNTVYSDLKAQQYNLDDQVRDVVKDINNLVSEVQLYNEKIASAEMAGDNANDYRDARNLALDELSQLLPITYTEKADGQIEITCEGNYLLSNGLQNKIGLRYTTDKYSFVEPVFTSSDEILPASNNLAKNVLDMTGTITAGLGNDESVLRALLSARGSQPVTYSSEAVKPDVTDTTKYPLGASDPQYQLDYQQYKEDKFNIEQATIPKTLKDLDTVFNKMCTLINDALAPQEISSDAPYDLEGNQSYLEIFVRKEEPYSDRYENITYDADGNIVSGDYLAEDADNYYSQYTMGNIIINPELMNVDGYDKISLSPTGDVSDNSLVLEIMDQWKDDTITMPGTNNSCSIEEGYNYLVSKLGNETNEASTYYEQQVTNMTNLENNRTSISGVSLDEEMTNMMKYQHSYSAAARLFNVIDSMIDTVVNRTGRVGL